MAPSIAYPTAQSHSPHPLSFKQPKSQMNVDFVELSSPSDSSDAEPELDNFDYERARLRQHLGLDSTHPPPYNHTQPLFFVERAPDTTIPIKCSLPGCKRSIKPESLRLALNPGMSGDTWFRSSSDYYHIPCFEAIADLSNDSTYLSRLIPLTRNTYHLRGLKPSSVSDGTYLISGGGERLILEWKLRRSMELDRRDGVYDPRQYELDNEISDLLYKAGERGFVLSGRPRGLDVFEYFTLARTVAVNEPDSFGEVGGWNLFEEFLDESRKEGGQGRERHGLSRMLERWEQAVTLSWQEKTTTTPGTKSALSPMAIRAIRRLSTIPTPQIGFNCIYS
ncbi:hypothetical protein BDV06DRAFT_26298 [Aspergillus oleicola]